MYIFCPYVQIHSFKKNAEDEVDSYSDSDGSPSPKRAEFEGNLEFAGGIEPIEVQTSDKDEVDDTSHGQPLSQHESEAQESTTQEDVNIAKEITVSDIIQRAANFIPSFVDTVDCEEASTRLTQLKRVPIYYWSIIRVSNCIHKHTQSGRQTHT